MIQVKVLSPLARLLGPGVRVEELAGMSVFSIERRIALRFERSLKRCFDFSAGLIALPFVTIASAAYRVYGTMTGKVRHFTEPRIGSGGNLIPWPRVVDAAGREGADLVKPGLCLHLIAGRLSLVGPPPLPEGDQTMVSDALRRVRPGITGSWRIARHETMERALEEEALGLESWSSMKDLMVVAESIGVICSGSYPVWFRSKGESV